jgi:hypothetical protein
MQQFALRIHGVMLADQRRNEMLRRAIEALVRPGDVVTDVGAGTGLLSMFAARAGALKVYALESGTIAFLARRLVEANGMSNVIEVIQTSSLKFNPPEQSDVVVSETLGYTALDERFRATMVDARDRMLRPGGALVPAALSIFAVPVETVKLPEQAGQLDWIEGLDFRPLAELFGRLYERRYIDSCSYLSDPQLVTRLDCYVMRHEGVIRCELEFIIDRPAILTGFALWFEALLSPGVSLSSQSEGSSNHWGQTFLPIRSLPVVDEGEEVWLRLSLDDQNGRFVVSWDYTTSRARYQATIGRQ